MDFLSLAPFILCCLVFEELWGILQFELFRDGGFSLTLLGYCLMGLSNFNFPFRFFFFGGLDVTEESSMIVYVVSGDLSLKSGHIIS